MAIDSMKNVIGILLTTICVISGCKASSSTIEFEASFSMSSFEECVSEITVIPLEDDNEHMLGDDLNLLLSEDSFILSDGITSRIFRYSRAGRFLNTIGAKGRGPAEYIEFNGVQIVDDKVNVYVPHGDVLTYLVDGTFVSRLTEENLGAKVWQVDEGFFTYSGYGSVSGYKAAYIREGKTISFMPSDEKVLQLSPRTNIFCEVPNGVVFIDSYTNDLLIFSNGAISNYLTIDFGKYALPKEFYEFDDAYAAAELMLSRTFALIQTYQESCNKAFLDVMVMAPDNTSRHYGISEDGQWRWFYLGKQDDIFAGAPSVLKDDVLYFVLDPAKLSTFPNSLKQKVSNPEVLDTLMPDSNYFIASVKLYNIMK